MKEIWLKAGQSQATSNAPNYEGRLGLSDRAFEFSRGRDRYGNGTFADGDKMPLFPQQQDTPAGFDSPIGLGLPFALSRLKINRRIEQLMIVSAAFGGSSSQEWQPNRGLFKTAVELTYEALTAYPDFTFMGIIWMQGERDARIGRRIGEYEARNSNVLNSMRAALPNSESSVVVAGGIQTNGFESAEIVNNEIHRMPLYVPRSIVYDTSDLTTHDGTHYDSSDTGIPELGRRLALGAQTLIGSI